MVADVADTAAEAFAPKSPPPNRLVAAGAVPALGAVAGLLGRPKRLPLAAGAAGAAAVVPGVFAAGGAAAAAFAKLNTVNEVA